MLNFSQANGTGRTTWPLTPHVMGVNSIFLLFLSKNLPVKTVLASLSLKFSLPIFLKCFLIFAEFQPHISGKKRVAVLMLALTKKLALNKQQ